MIIIVNLFRFLTTRREQQPEDKMLSKIFKSTAFLYLLVLLVSIFGGGLIVRFYGETCGINIFKPRTWIMTATLMGSPYCKTLNWLSFISTSVVENMYWHILTITITYLLSFVPKEAHPQKKETFAGETRNVL